MQLEQAQLFEGAPEFSSTILQLFKNAPAFSFRMMYLLSGGAPACSLNMFQLFEDAPVCSLSKPTVAVWAIHLSDLMCNICTAHTDHVP